jgi:hypothetical protein
MGKTAGHILKSDNVRMEGQFRLDTSQGMPPPANARNTALASAQVHVVESHPEFAVMEVICGCGAKINIRCEYTDA